MPLINHHSTAWLCHACHLSKVCRLSLIFRPFLPILPNVKRSGGPSHRRPLCMSLRNTRLVALLFCLGFCPFVAGTGCSFHQTSGGFVFDSHWSLECCDHPPWVEVRRATDPNGPDSKPGLAIAASGAADAATPKSPAGQDEQTIGKPELLPWRSRLKDYRLAARVVGKNATPSDTAGEASAKATSAATPSQPRPGQAGPAPEANRPDPVIE